MMGGPVIVLSGGVGGAKLVLGLSRVLPPERLIVVTNTADDFDHLGLRVCPDTDTVLYTLAGLADAERGWGRTAETWTFMRTLADLGGADWFNLGDGDLALHVLRSEWLRLGHSATEVTARLASRMKVAASVLPMSDQMVATIVQTADGPLAFQDYFVLARCAQRVTGIAFNGIEAARPNPLFLAALRRGPAAIVIAPSNPFVSVDPILAVPGMRVALRASGAPVVAVSPIVGGAAIKGPAAKMMAELGHEVSALGVARHYLGFADALVIDETDRALAGEVAALGMRAETAPTVMRDLSDRIALARRTLALARTLVKEPAP